MAGDHRIGLRGIAPGRLIQIARPGPRIAHLGAARGEDVVQAARGDLGGKKGLFRLDQHIEFRRSLGARDDLEFKVDAVHHPRLAGFGDGVGRRDQRQGAGGNAHADAAAHLTRCARRKAGAELVGRPAHHRTACHDVFRCGFLHEAVGRDHRYLAGLDRILVGDAAHAAEMVTVAVGIEHRADRALAQRVVDQLHRCLRRLDTGQRVDHDPPRLAADHGHVRNVEAAHLPDVLRYLVKPVALQVGHMPPQRGVDRLGRGAGDEGVGIEVPDRLAVGGKNHGILARGEEAARRIGSIARAFGRQVLQGDALFEARRFAGGCRSVLCGGCAGCDNQTKRRPGAQACNVHVCCTPLLPPSVMPAPRSGFKCQHVRGGRGGVICLPAIIQIMERLQSKIEFF